MYNLINTFCSNACLFILLLGFPSIIIWFIVALVKKKNWKNPLKAFGISIVAIIVLTIVGSSAWRKTEDYQEYLTEKNETKVNEDEKIKEQEEKADLKKEEEVKETPAPLPTQEETIPTPTPKPTKKPNATNTPTPTPREEKFLVELKKYMEVSLAERAYIILKNEIGFNELEFEEKIDSTFNYEITADGYKIIITDMEDDVRIFIPNSSYVFYENGSVVLTKSEMEDRRIDQYDKSTYYIMAQDIVLNCLKNPSSADFPSIVTKPEEIAMQKNGNLIAVQSYVDAKNSFGAEVRSQWLVQFVVLDMDTYSYELVYANVSGDKIGEFVEME